jgi:hypothetical protein
MPELQLRIDLKVSDAQIEELMHELKISTPRACGLAFVGTRPSPSFLDSLLIRYLDRRGVLWQEPKEER